MYQGAPHTTNPIDGTRFFVRQLYVGILNREPDQGGWDNWVSAIIQCNVNPSCIYGKTGRQVWVVRQFSFRKRNLTIDVSATNTKPTLDRSELNKNAGDERKLAGEFALIVADAIKDK